MSLRPYASSSSTKLGQLQPPLPVFCACPPCLFPGQHGKCFLDPDFGCKTTWLRAAEISFWVLLTLIGGSVSALLLLSCLGICIGAVHLLGSRPTQPSCVLFFWSLLQPLRAACCRKKPEDLSQESSRHRTDLRLACFSSSVKWA